MGLVQEWGNWGLKAKCSLLNHQVQPSTNLLRDQLKMYIPNLEPDILLLSYKNQIEESY